jgi:flavin-dependent dehydrogenase
VSSIDQLRSDVLVIGGGPAGLAAAIALRLQGMRVAVADARQPPIDKACGEGILPAGIEALRRLGVPLRAADGFPFRGIRFIENSISVEATFPTAFAIGLRRTRLHELLTERAAELGVQLLWGTHIPSISSFPFCGWIVGADGQQSQVRREAGLDSVFFMSRRLGFRRHYRLAPWTDKVEVSWGAYGQLYVTPVGPDEIGVALLSRDSHLRLDAALREFPALERRLRNAQPTSSEQGSSTTTRRLRRVFRGRTVLIGDASGSVDAIAGEGLSLAFQQAIALAESMAAGDLRVYQAKHRQLALRPEITAGLLLALDRLPWLRRGAWRGLAAAPSIFSRLLSPNATRPGAQCYPAPARE